MLTIGWISAVFAADIPTICTMDYTPVCASVQVQCIKAPCPPIPETFGNACMMHANTNTTYLYDWECKTDSLDKTSWNIQSFDDKSATWATLSFADKRISANVCNVKWADYSLSWNKIIVGQMISTMMACMWAIDTYERAFDLSWAKFELSSDGGNHLMITTIAGHKFQWQNQNPTLGKPIGMPNPASVNCINNSGTLEIIDGTGGQYGMCTFPDGSKCEEWSYFKGTCSPTHDKLQKVMDSYLSVRKFTANWYQAFISNLQQTVTIGLANATWVIKNAYMQVENFLKNF